MVLVAKHWPQPPLLTYASPLSSFVPVCANGPCIRPPDYETDFAAQIREQCAECGVPQEAVVDSEVSTASDLERYYSYRVEKGKTGRMLAMLGRRT